MKTLFALSSMVSAVITGIASLHLFERAEYDVSALLTIASFLTLALLVSIAGSKRIIVK